MLKLWYTLLLPGVLLVTDHRQPGTVDLKALKKVLAPESDTVYVLNFWATWCKPCVEEMPAFTAMSRDMQGQKVRLMLLSLDSRKRVPDSTMLAFLERQHIPAELVSYLDAGDPNTWMPLVDASWDGAIPATLMFRKGSKPVFINESVTYEALMRNTRELLK